MKKHILMIDDDIELCELLASYLSTAGFTVTCRHDGVSGLAKAFDKSIDLILLDVMMPKLSGFDVLKAFGNNHPVPILMLTAKGDDRDRILGLELGADDYLPKPFHHQELLARINAIFRRIEITQQHADTEHLLNVNDVVIDNATRQVTCNEQIVELTGTEFEILFELMTQKSVIVSKEQLSEQVLKRKLSPFDRSIDMHVSNIRRKLSQYAQDDKIKTIRGAGYTFLAGATLA